MMMIFQYFVLFLKNLNESYHDPLKIIHDFFLKSEHFRHSKLTRVRKLE